MGGIQEPGHLRRGLALDAHGQAKGANFQVGDTAIEHLPEQIGRLFSREGARAVLTASDFFDVVANTHAFHSNLFVIGWWVAVIRSRWAGSWSGKWDTKPMQDFRR